MPHLATESQSLQKAFRSQLNTDEMTDTPEIALPSSSRQKENTEGALQVQWLLLALLISANFMTHAQQAHLASSSGSSRNSTPNSANNVMLQANAIRSHDVGAATLSSSLDFGTIDLGSTSAPATLTYTFTGAGSGVSVTVLTLGAKGRDFTDTGSGTCTTNGTSHTYAVGDTCTVNVALAPRLNGPRYGAVQLTNINGQIVSTTYVHGIGYGPQIAYLSATQSNVGSGFSGPISVALDGSGNVYVASIGLNAIEEYVAADGSMKTLGGGFLLPAGVAVDGAGNVYVADTYNNAIKEILSADGTILTLGNGFSTPSNVAVDGSGNVYVADIGNSAIKEILASDGSVRTLSNDPNGPAGVAIDGNGNVYVADLYDGTVKEILATDGTERTLGSSFNLPRDLAVDGIGNVFVTDTYDNELKEISVTDGSIRTIGSGFDVPNGVAVDSNGDVYVADYSNNRVVLEGYAQPPSLTFVTPTQVDAVDTTDGPQSFTLENIGSAPLTLITSTGGTDPHLSAGFTLVTGGTAMCPSLSNASSNVILLASNANCTYAVNFAPVADGAIQGQLVLVNNNLTAYGPGTTTSQTIPLSGNGIGNPTITVTSNLPGASVGANYSGSFSATGGSAPYTFVAAGLPFGLALSSAGVLTGTPTVADTYTISVTATDAGSFAGIGSFTLIVSGAADFQLTTTSAQTQVVAYGTFAKYAFTVTPINGSFTSPVSFAVPELPPGYTAIFSPSSATPGSSAVSTQLTIETPGSTSSAKQASVNLYSAMTAFLLLLFLPIRRPRRRMQHSLLTFLLLTGALVTSMSLTGCGPDIINPSTYNLVVTATGGNQQHSANISLTVQ